MNFWRLLRLAGMGGMAATILRLAAQDVTVSPLMWLEPQNAGDELPVQTGFTEPKFPADLKKTTQIGWVEIDSFIDEHGVLFLREIHASLPFYEQAVWVAFGRKAVSYKPARRGGRPIAARIRQCVVFHPASAGLTQPEATPRLLSAEMIVDPRRVATSEATRLPPEVVWVDVHLDAAGVVTAVESGSKEGAELIGAQLRRWRFAPARRAGQPVATDLRVPVIVTSPGGLRLDGMVPARVVARVPPEYPFAERQAGYSGRVLLEFTVDPAGRVRDVRAVRMTTSAFALAAEQSVRAWRFLPASVAGKPVATRLQQEITFMLTDSFDEDEDDGSGVVVSRRGDVSKMPEALRYDLPPKVHRLVQPKYPYALLREGVGGLAQVTVIVDAQGKVIASKVVRADRPEFGYALQAAVEYYEYRPAVKNGDPTAAMLTVEERFEPKAENSLIVLNAERDALKLEGRNPERIAGSGELDAKPKPIDILTPVYPRSLSRRVAGKALVEFLIDPWGGVLLPRVVSATDPTFGYAAAQAVARWKFLPPTRQGTAVTARVRIPIDFPP